MATYYVDATLGDDSDDGLDGTPQGGGTGPWQTISKVNGETFSAGDSILFKCGETWRETLTVPDGGASGNHITFGQYSSGADPIISGGDLITTWTSYSGNTWQSSVSTEPNIVFLDGTRLTEGSDKDSLNDHEWVWESSVLYVRDETGDPDVTGVDIEAGQRNYCIDTAWNDFLTFDGLTLRCANRLRYGATYVNDDAGPITFVFQNCTITDNVGCGVYVKNNTTNGSFLDNTISNNGWHGIGYVGTGSETNQTITGNTINGNGWYVDATWDFGSGIFGNITSGEIANNTIYSNGTGGGAGKCHGIYVSNNPTGGALTIHDNVIYDHTKGNAMKVSSSASIYNNHCYDNHSAGIVVDSTGSNNVTASIYYNLLRNNVESGGSSGISVAKGSGTLSVSIYNNTLYDNGESSGEILINCDPDTLNIKNNLIYTLHNYYIRALELTGTVSIDNNSYYNSQTGTPFYYNGAAENFTAWKAESFSPDASSITSDPSLVNVGGTTAMAYRLLSASSCSNQGTDVSLSTDYFGNSVAATPDIGFAEIGPFSIYVDATSGDDAAVGLTTGSAWKTINKVNGETFSAGDSILFKCGEVWREQLTVPSSGSSGSPITFGQYGSGADPIIYGSDEKNDAGDWTQDGNLWYWTTATEPDVAYRDAGSGFSAMTKVAKADCDADGEWSYDSGNIYVYDSTGEPTRSGTRDFEFPQRANAIVCNKDWVTLENLELLYPTAEGYRCSESGGGTITGLVCDGLTIDASSGDACITIGGGGNTTFDQVTIQDCTLTPPASGAAKHGIEFPANNYVTNTTISGNTIAAAGEDAIAIAENAGNSHDITISDNVCGGNGENSIDIKDAYNVTISDNTLTDDVEYAIVIHNQGGADPHDVTIEGNTIHGAGQGGGSAHAIFLHNCNTIIIRRNFFQDIIDGGIALNDADSVEIYYNLFDNVQGVSEFGAFVEVSGDGGNGIEIYNNVFYDAALAGVWLNSGGDAQNVTIKNNIFSGNHAAYIRVESGETAGFSSNRNCFYGSAAGTPFRWNGTDYSLADWKTNSSQDANSINSDPLFVNAGGTTAADYKLTSGSPCRDQGTDVGLTRDYFGIGVPLGDDPDIGFSEFIIDFPVHDRWIPSYRSAAHRPQVERVYRT